MKLLFTILLSFIAFQNYSLGQKTDDIGLLASIKLTIKPQYSDWIAFSNGTYLIITADSATPNLNQKAIDILRKNEHQIGKKLDKDNYVISLKNINGWVVDSDVEGLYTYVGVDELKKFNDSMHKDTDIVLYAIQKRKMDIAEAKIIFTTQ